MKKIIAVLLAGIVVFCAVRHYYEALLRRRYEQRRRVKQRSICKRIRVPHSLLDDLHSGILGPGLFDWIGIECSGRARRRLYVVDYGQFLEEDLEEWQPDARGLYLIVQQEDAHLCTGDALPTIRSNTGPKTDHLEAIHIFALHGRPALCYRPPQFSSLHNR